MAHSIERALVAQGPLRERPFCHLLLDAQRRETSGTLILIAEASGEVRIRLDRGRPNKAWLATEASDLLQALLPLCMLAQGSFQLYEDVDLLSGVADAIAGHIDPRRLLVASLEKHVRPDVMDHVLSRHANSALRLRVRADLGWLRLAPQDGALIELIRAAPSSPEELIAQAPLPAERTRRLLYALLVTQTLVAYDQTSHEFKRSQPTNPSSPLLGRGSTSSSPAWKALSSLRPQSHPGALPSSPKLPVAGAPIASGHSSPAWKALVSLHPRVVSRVSSIEADKLPTLTSLEPSSSAGSTPVVAQRLSGTQAVVTPASTIAEDDIPGRIRRVEELVKNGRHDEALEEVSALLKREPNRAELHGLHGFVLFEQHSKDPSGLPRRVLEALKKALWIDPEETYALYTRGLICKRGGDSARALAHFQRVLEIEPAHAEAQREVRLAKVRGGKKAGR